MAVYLITLSLLIAAVLLIRAVFRKTLSPRFMYAIWLAVVIKLCLPMPLFEVALPALHAAPLSESVETEETAEPVVETTEDAAIETPAPVSPSVPTVVPGTAQTPVVTPSVPTVTPSITTPAVTGTPSTAAPVETASPVTTEPPKTPAPTEPTSIPLGTVVTVVWTAGSAVMALWFFISGSIFRYRLYADRQLHRTIRKTKVYVTSAAGAPCLAGLIPSIYITPEAATNKSKTLIMIHEYTHLRHGDHIWSFVRMLALIVYWWNPLVWAAAFASKQDAELACDDAIAAKLDDEKRFEYAHILLDTVPQRHHYAVALGSAPIKERILMLTKKRKSQWICAILAIVLTAAAVGCSFIGVKDPADVDVVTSVLVAGTDALPGAAEDALFSASAMGGSPVYYIFDESLTYYRHGIADGTYREYAILLPEEYTGGRIYYASAGAGSGEMRFVIETEQDGETVYLDCYFYADYETEPAGNLVLTASEILPEAEALHLAVYSDTQSALWLFERSDAEYIQNWITKLQDFYAGKTEERSSWEDLPEGAVIPSSLHIDDCTKYEYPLTSQTPVVLRFDAGEWWLYTGFTLLDIGNRADFSEMLWHLSEAWFIPKADWTQDYDALVDKYKFYFETAESDGSLRYTGVKYHNYITGESARISNVENLEPFTLVSNGAGMVLMESMSHGFFVIDLTGGMYYSLSTNRLPYFVYSPTSQRFAEYGAYVWNSARWLDGNQLYAENESGGFVLTFADNECTFTQGTLLDESSVIPFIPEGTMRQVDALPADADTAIMESGAIGGNPKFYQFKRGLTYYVHNVHDGTVYECTLPMPAGATNGTIIDMTPGGGSGEVNITLKVKKNGAVVSYTYLIDCFKSHCTPTYVWYPYNPTEEFGTGPFVGYVTDAETPWIDLYTAKDGVRVGQIPYEIFHDWIATDRENPAWTAGWMDEYVCFYYAEFHEHRWAAAHLADTVMGSGRKNVAVSDDGGKTWSYGSTGDDYGGNHVTGIGFASENVAFMSFHFANESAADGTAVTGPVISRTTDGGKTWKRLEIALPKQLQGYQMNGLCPVFDGDDGIYPIQLYDNGQKDAVVYLVTSDGGLTWNWQTLAGDATLPRWRDDEYLIPVASYGDGGGVYAYTYYSAAEEGYITKIRPGTDGTAYAVFERRNKYDETNTYRGTVTYRVTTKGGSVTQTEEVPTLDVEKIRKSAAPYTGSMLGTHTAKVWDNGRLYTCTFTFYEAGRAELTVTEDGTDYSEYLYGNYDLTRSTGKLTSGLVSQETKYRHTLYASVWEYSDGENSFMILFPETSKITGLSPDAPFPLVFAALPADTNIREYDIDIPLNEENREYITSAASYGEKPGISYGDKIRVGEEGVRYEVFGVGSHFRKGGRFSAYKTYRITTEGGYLTEIEETETFTKDIVRQNGKPVEAVHTGMYEAISYCMENGPTSYVVYLREQGKISAGAGLTGTDAGGTSEGTYSYDPETGTFSAELVIRTAMGGEITVSNPQTVSGKLYEYGGFVHFLCEESETFAITPDDPLPLTFVPNVDGSQDPAEVALDKEFDGDWYHSFSDENGQQFYYLHFDTAAAEMRFYYGYYESEYVNCYVGSYMVNPLTRLVNATLVDLDTARNDPAISLSFHLGYSITAEDGAFVKRLMFSPEGCSAEKYQHLVGRNYSFAQEPLMPVNLPAEEAPALQSYTMTFDSAVVTLEVPGTWYWDGASFVEKATQPGPYDEVKRADLYPTEQSQTEYEQTLWQSDPPYGRQAITGRTDQGLYFTGYSREYSEIPGQPSRWYRFYLSGDSGSYVVGIRQNLNQDGADFLESTVIPLLESIFVEAKTEAKSSAGTPSASDPCMVHGQDYHAYPLYLVEYVGTDTFDAWHKKYEGRAAADGSCAYGANLYKFIHETGIPRDVFEEYHFSTQRYWGHDYPVDLLYGADEAAAEAYYAAYKEREGINNEKNSFQRIRRSLLDYAEKSADTAFRQFYENHVIDNMVQEWSVADFVRETGIEKEALRDLINGFKRVEVTGNTIFLNCFDLDYDALYRIAATLEKTTLLEKLTEDLLFCGLSEIGPGEAADTNRPAILSAYKAATEAAWWFRGRSLLDKNTFIDAKNVVVRGELNYHYYKADRFATYEAFRKYLENLFSVPYVDSLLSSITYIEHDGMLYGMLGDTGSDPRMGEETYTILQESDTKYILRVTVEVLEGGNPKKVVGYETFDFPYEYIDKKWVFTDFPKIR